MLFPRVRDTSLLYALVFCVTVGELHRYDRHGCPSSAVLLHNALPFVGFGFLDNCIMIVAVSPTASETPAFVTL